MDIVALITREDISDAAKLTYLLIAARGAKGIVPLPEDVQDARRICRATYFSHLGELRRARLVQPGCLTVIDCPEEQTETLNTEQDSSSSSPESCTKNSHSRSIYTIYNKEYSKVELEFPVQQAGLVDRLQSLEAAAKKRACDSGVGGRGCGVSIRDMDAAWACASRSPSAPLEPLALLGKWRSRYARRYGHHYVFNATTETGVKLYRGMQQLVDAYTSTVVGKAVDVYFSETKALCWLKPRNISFFLRDQSFSRWIHPLLIDEELEKKAKAPKLLGSGTRGRLVRVNGKVVQQGGQLCD